MAGSGVVSSWASSIVGNLTPPKKIQQPSQGQQQHHNAHNQVNVYMPPFTSHIRPDLYIEWEYEINAIFASHNFDERGKFQAVLSTFSSFALVWWSEYCRLNHDFIHTTWDDLKLVMRYRFVDVYYTRGMIKKLQHLKQGTDTVTKYYDDLQTTLLHSFLEVMKILWIDFGGD